MVVCSITLVQPEGSGAMPVFVTTRIYYEMDAVLNRKCTYVTGVVIEFVVVH